MEARNPKGEILSAAVTEFARYGLNGARVDRIAQRARANKRMIYYYFQSKQGLYNHVLNQVYHGIVDAMKDRLVCYNGSNEVERLQVIWEAYFQYLSSNPHYVAMISWENLQQGRYSEDADIPRVTHPMVQQVSQLLEANNLLPEDLNSRHYILYLLAIAFFYFSNQYTVSMILGPDLFLEDEEKMFLENMKKMIIMPLKKLHSDDAARQGPKISLEIPK